MQKYTGDHEIRGLQNAHFQPKNRQKPPKQAKMDKSRKFAANDRHRLVDLPLCAT
jgi:hypothetical protein